MDLCAGFTTSTDCVVYYNNLYNIKIATLLIITALMLYLYYNHDKIKIQTYVDYWKSQLYRIIPKVYFISLIPMALFLLRHTIDYELFLEIILGFYFIFIVILIGIILAYGQISIFRIFGFTSYEDFRDKNKRMRESRR